MTKDNKAYVKERLGYLFKLINLEYQMSLIQALSHFLEVTTATFQLGKHEMVPTLEEYKATIEIDFESKIVEPPIGLKPTSVIAEFLNLKTHQVEKLIKSNTGNFPLSYLVTNNELFA